MSASQSVSVPTPAAARNCAAGAPRPPTPTISACAAANRSCASMPELGQQDVPAVAQQLGVVHASIAGRPDRAPDENARRGRAFRRAERRGGCATAASPARRRALVDAMTGWPFRWFIACVQLEVVGRAEFEARRLRRRVGLRWRSPAVLSPRRRRRPCASRRRRRLAARRPCRRLEVMLEVRLADAVRRVAAVVDRRCRARCPWPGSSGPPACSSAPS